MRHRPSLFPVRTTRLRWLTGLLALALTAGVLAAFPTLSARAATVYQVFSTNPTPKVPMDSDTAAIEVGMKFRVSATGATATGVRFYKGTRNTGTHTGSLWDISGNRLATVTFTGETASGWQTANFPVVQTLNPNQTYVVSYYAPAGRYAVEENGFTAAKINGALTGLASGTDGGNGVYKYGSGGGFPNGTYNASNYYVDVTVSVDGGADTTPPTVVSQTPAAGTNGVAVTSSVSATFSEAVQSATVAMTLSAGSTAVAAGVSYDATSKTVTLTPTANLANSTTYTAKVSGAKDIAGNTMADVSWTFTTAAASTTGCPCTIWPSSTVPAVAAAADDSAVELGVRFRANRTGYITGLRFYKGTGNTGTHLGSLWNGAGTSKLGSLTFAGESATGWQSASFGAPIPISANTTYVASYFAPAGRYAATTNGLASAVTNGPLTALASGTDGNNGLYNYGGSAFPSYSYQKSNYWVDVVFDSNASDTTPPTVTAKVPAAGASGVAVTTPVSATFSEPVNSAAIELRDANNALVAGSVAYDATAQRITLTPSSTLAYSSSYTVNVSGAKDGSGNTMSPISWTFTTGAPPPPGPGQGPGGPIAVVTSASNPYATYLAEILRTEGLNEFATIDASTLSDATLANYDTVVLGAVSVTDAQAASLTNWVTAGGNLIAMKPGANLSSLLGITSKSASLTDAYLKVDTTTAPGAGIVADSIQFHSSADRYTAGVGTQSVAALWSSATVATTDPAVTLRNVGAAGGQAAAFTYDLPRSIALTRQGNPAWAGTERDNDGNGIIRSDDMFFGGTSPDWVDFSKVAIPQADEQQRLLANLIQLVNRDRKPLPRFWYFPNAATSSTPINPMKAVLVGTGDDHQHNGTAGRFDQLIANSQTGCAGSDSAAAALLANWNCLRYSSYMWNGTPMDDSVAASYDSKGFEIGLHPRTSGNDPSINYTASSVNTIYTNQLAAFRSDFPSLPTQQSVRMHAIVWSDWASQVKTEVANGIRLDTNYYYWPEKWIKDRPGLMTGSGMAMRFTDTDGSILDNYQATTQMTDESGQSYPATVNALLNNALGAKGYYGSFVANMHTDASTEPQSDALIQAALDNNVPLISSKQLLTWLDGRNGSSYSNLAWSSNTLGFKVNVGAGANNLLGMLPTAGPNGSTLSKITKTGSGTVTTSTQTIKGLEYATFLAGAGTYTATYSGGSAAAPDPTQANARVAQNTAAAIGASAPAVSAASVDAVAAQRGVDTFVPPVTANAKTVSWSTKVNASTRVLMGTSPKRLSIRYSVGESTRTHKATLVGLKPRTTYYYRVASTDTTGATSLSPAATAAPASFTTTAADVTAPVLSAAPEITALPDGTAQVSWSTSEPTSSIVTTGDTATTLAGPVVDSAVTSDHTVLLTDLDPGKAYYFSTDSADAAGNKVVSTPTKFVTPNYGVGQALAPSFRTGNASGSVSVALKKLGILTLKNKIGTAQSGSYTSKPLDAMMMVDWVKAVVAQDVPSGTTVTISYRSGSTSVPDKSWSAWTTMGADNKVGGSGRYLQYRVDLAATASAISVPSVSAIGFTSNGQPPVLEGEVGPR